MRRKLLLIFISFVFFFIIIYFTFNSYFFSYALYNHYPGISYYYISTKLTEEESDIIKKSETLVNYIYQNVFLKSSKVEDSPPLIILIRGIGYCDQVAHLFIRLMEPLDIRGYLVFLEKNKDGTEPSPHSIAVVTLKTKRLLEPSEVIEEGVVVDVLQGVILKNKSGQPATFYDICSRNVLDSHQKNFFNVFKYDLYCNKPRIFLRNTPLSLDSKKRQFFYKYIYPILPEKVIHIYQDLVLHKWYRKSFEKELDFLYYKARNYHIYERFDEAKELYETIINNTTDKSIISKCLFFEGMLYFRMKKFNNAKEKFKSIIKNYPNSSWFPLAQKWLFEAGKFI